MFKSKVKAKTVETNAPDAESMKKSIQIEDPAPEETIITEAEVPSISVQFKDWLYYAKQKTATDAVAELVEKAVKEKETHIKWGDWAYVFGLTLERLIHDEAVKTAYYTAACCPEGGTEYNVEIEGYCTADEEKNGFVGGSPVAMTVARYRWYAQNAVEYYLNNGADKRKSLQPVRYSKAVKAVIVDEIINYAITLRRYCADAYIVLLGASEVYGGVEAGCKSGKLQAKCSGTETWTDEGWVRPIVGYQVVC